jgi:RHS repeat-associated protein
VDTNNHTGFAQVVEELVGGAVTRQYTYGHDLISQRQLVAGEWKQSFYGYDGHGSVRYLTDLSGGVTDTYTYDVFGSLIARTGSTPNNYMYAGEQFDPHLGFYYNRARYMNPSSGRFFTMDVYEGNGQDPASLHKYLYANADPVNNTDPSGYTTLAETNAVMAQIANLSRIAFKVIDAIDKASSIADAINSVLGIVKLVQSGTVQSHFEMAAKAVRQGISSSKNVVRFTSRQAVESLENNLPHILSRSFVPWSKWLGSPYGKHLKGLLLYLPNPGFLPLSEPIPTGLKLGKLPVLLQLGGKTKKTSLIGVGVLAPKVPHADKRQQIWRMDYHRMYDQHGGSGKNMANPNEIAVWEDNPFHYHVMKPVPNP